MAAGDEEGLDVEVVWIDGGVEGVDVVDVLMVAGGVEFVDEVSKGIGGGDEGDGSGYSFFCCFYNFGDSFSGRELNQALIIFSMTFRLADGPRLASFMSLRS